MASYDDIPAGQSPDTFTPGDILACHANDWSDRLVRAGERLRGAGEYAWTSHIVCVADTCFVEALGHGVRYTPYDWYQPVDYRIIHTGLAPADAARAVAFWQTQVGDPYGWVTDIGIGVTALTHSKLSVLKQGTYICSGLASAGLAEAGVELPRIPETMMPSDLMKFYGVPPKPAPASP